MSKDIKKVRTNYAVIKFLHELLQANRKCELCADKGIDEISMDCHHIVPISKGRNFEEMMQLAMDPENVICLCRNCHWKLHHHLDGVKLDESIVNKLLEKYDWVENIDIDKFKPKKIKVSKKTLTTEERHAVNKMIGAQIKEKFGIHFELTDKKTNTVLRFNSKRELCQYIGCGKNALERIIDGKSKKYKNIKLKQIK